jgi:hypothetical protein
MLRANTTFSQALMLTEYSTSAPVHKPPTSKVHAEKKGDEQPSIDDDIHNLEILTKLVTAIIQIKESAIDQLQIKQADEYLYNFVTPRLNDIRCRRGHLESHVFFNNLYV